jgi:hypothetical protein
MDRRSAATVCVFLLFTGLVSAGEKKRDLDFSGDAASPTPSASPPRFDVPIPIGHDAQGTGIPYWDARGKLQMYIWIEKAVRLDQEHLDMTNAFMQSYDAREWPEANVFMTRSVLDLNTRVVTSDVPATVRRSDFEIVGKKMVFNTQTRVGRMTGHVRMTVYDLQDMSSASPSPSPAASSTATAPQGGATPKPGATPQS